MNRQAFLSALIFLITVGNISNCFSQNTLKLPIIIKINDDGKVIDSLFQNIIVKSISMATMESMAFNDVYVFPESTDLPCFKLNIDEIRGKNIIVNGISEYSISLRVRFYHPDGTQFWGENSYSISKSVDNLTEKQKVNLLANDFGKKVYTQNIYQQIRFPKLPAEKTNAEPAKNPKLPISIGLRGVFNLHFRDHSSSFDYQSNTLYYSPETASFGYFFGNSFSGEVLIYRIFSESTLLGLGVGFGSTSANKPMVRLINRDWRGNEKVEDELTASADFVKLSGELKLFDSRPNGSPFVLTINISRSDYSLSGDGFEATMEPGFGAFIGLGYKLTGSSKGIFSVLLIAGIQQTTVKEFEIVDYRIEGNSELKLNDTYLGVSFEVLMFQ